MLNSLARRVLSVFLVRTTPAVLLGDLNMLRCFAGTGIPTIVATTDPGDVTLRSRHARRTALIARFDDPDPERPLADLERLAAGERDRPVLFYGTDEQLLFLSRHHERLVRTFRFRLPPIPAAVLVDKIRFGAFARSRGLPVPAQLASRGSTPDEALARLRLPCVIKPARHIGWFTHARLHGGGPRKAIIVHTPGELRAAWDAVAAYEPSFIVQEYIPGGEHEIYSFHAYIDAAGGVLAWFVGRKVRTFPRDAGVSTFLHLVDEPRVAMLGRDLVARAELRGPVKLDLKHDPTTDRFYLFDINARFNLWHHLGAAAGINLPRIAYDDLVGVRQPAGVALPYATDIHWLSFSNDVRTFLRSYHPAGELGWGAWLSSLVRGRKVFDVFAWDDPMPSVASVLHYARAASKRLA
jgi:D-aspartate ligase